MDDRANTKNSFSILTGTTLTGLDMPSVAEKQTLFIQAGSGTYKLRAAGFGTEAGLPNYTSSVAGKTIVVSRFVGYAEIALGFDLAAADVELAMEKTYGSTGVRVVKFPLSSSLGQETYTITWGGTLAGHDIPELAWAETLASNGLTKFGSNTSVDLRIATVRDGNATPVVNSVQTLTVNATAGTFQLHLLGQTTQAIVAVIPGTSTHYSLLREIETSAPLFGGDDFINAGNGSDVVLGGSGRDRIDGGSDNSGDIILGDNGQAKWQAGRLVSIKSADRALGGGDFITASSGDNILIGDFGNDAIRGGSGHDRLNGEAGNDTLLGSAGDDTIRSGGGNDRIDGGDGNDRIEATSSVIAGGAGNNIIVGTKNCIDEAFTFDFDKLLA